MRPKIRANPLWILAVLVLPGPLEGQQINLSTPFGSASDSFFESFNVGFGFSLRGGTGNGSRVVGLLPNGQLTPNLVFTQNSAGAAIPAFGGFDPGTGARFGFARLSPGGAGFSLGISLAQGNTRTLVSTTPSITILNGGFGAFQSVTLSPFVTGVIPVVGTDNAVTRGIASGKLRPYDPLRSRQEQPQPAPSPKPRFSTAASGDISVAEIHAQRIAHEANTRRALETAMQDAQNAAESGDYRQTRIHIRQAIRLNDDPVLAHQLRLWLKEFSGK